MIYFKRYNWEKYKGYSSHLDTALTYLASNDLNALVAGRNEVDGENVFINRMTYTTMMEEDTFFEAHLNYIDIHVVLDGQEYIGVSDIQVLEEFDRDEAADFIGYKGSIEGKCLMNETNMLVVFPEDAHMVKMMCDAQSKVEKVVVKVRV